MNVGRNLPREKVKTFIRLRAHSSLQTNNVTRATFPRPTAVMSDLKAKHVDMYRRGRVMYHPLISKDWPPKGRMSMICKSFYLFLRLC